MILYFMYHSANLPFSVKSVYLRSIHYDIHWFNLFILTARQYSVEWIHCLLFIHSLINRRLSSLFFLMLAIGNILVCTETREVSLRTIPGSRIVGLWAFQFSRYHRLVFWIQCTNLQLPPAMSEGCTPISFPVLVIFWFLHFLNESDGYKVIICF